MIIGITGTNGAGKGTVVEYLVKEKGFAHYSVRDFLTGHIPKDSPSTRKALQDAGDRLRTSHGPAYIVTELLRKAREKGGDAVIESVRASDEAVYLRENDAVLLGVDADFRVRYERIQGRRAATDAVSFERFIADEQREFENTENNKQNLKEVLRLSDAVLHNNAPVEALYAQVDAFLKKYREVITPQNYATASLDDWQAGFYHLYGHIDDRRSLDGIWRHAFVNTSRFSSQVRKNNFGSSFASLAHVLCWTLSFAERCRRSGILDGNDFFATTDTLAHMVWRKYPGRCSYCSSMPCWCATLKEPGKANGIETESNDGTVRPGTLDEWGSMFERIYGQAHSSLPVETLAFHFVEETGEVMNEIIRITEFSNGASVEDKKAELFLEVADVFSWIASLVSKIDATYFSSPARYVEKVEGLPTSTAPVFTLARVLWDEYGSASGLLCPTCRHNPCSCDRTLKL